MLLIYYAFCKKKMAISIHFFLSKSEASSESFRVCDVCLQLWYVNISNYKTWMQAANLFKKITASFCLEELQGFGDTLSSPDEEAQKWIWQPKGEDANP